MFSQWITVSRGQRSGSVRLCLERLNVPPSAVATLGVGSSYYGMIFPELIAHTERDSQKGWEDVS